MRISPGIVAATVAAFATSSPELTVSINAALHGTPRIALGDALGSNVVNVALILGSALLIGVLHAPRGTIKRDFPTALVVPVIIAVPFADGELSRIDGIMLLAIFLVWLAVVVIRAARRERSVVEAVLGAYPPGRALIEGAHRTRILLIAGGPPDRHRRVGDRSGVWHQRFHYRRDGGCGGHLGAGTRHHHHLAPGGMTRWGSAPSRQQHLQRPVHHRRRIHDHADPDRLRAGRSGADPWAGRGRFTDPPRSGIIDRSRGLMLLALYAVYLVAILQGRGE